MKTVVSAVLLTMLVACAAPEQPLHSASYVNAPPPACVLDEHLNCHNPALEPAFAGTRPARPDEIGIPLIVGFGMISPH